MRKCHECIIAVLALCHLLLIQVLQYMIVRHMFMGRVAALVLHAHCWVGITLSPEMPIRHQFYQLYSKQI